MTQINKSRSGCGCLPLTLLTVASIGAGYYYGKGFIGAELTAQNSAKIIPQSAFVTGYISTDSKQWSKLEQYADPKTQKLINDDLNNWLDRQVKQFNEDIDYQEDIAPWIGGVSVVALPSSEAGIDFETVSIIGIKNKWQAWRFLSKQEKALKNEIEEQKYKNVKIYYLPEKDQVWITSFSNYLVVSDSEAGIKKIIDTHKGDPSLKEIYQQNISVKNPAIQIHFPKYDRLLVNAIDDFLPEIDSGKLSQSELAKINSLSVNLTIEDYGLNLKTLFNLSDDFNRDKLLYKPVSGKILAQIPQESLLVMNGGGINQVWETIEAEKNNIPELDEAVREFQQYILNSFNLDLDADFIRWLDGEYAIAISSFSVSNVNALMVLETSNQAQGNETLNQLNKSVSSFPFMKVNQKKIGRTKVTEWNSRIGNNILSYGWLNKKNLLLTFGSDFETVSQVKSGNSLLNDPTFRLTTKSFPQDNYGYLYWDIEKTIEQAKRINPGIFNYVDPEVESLTESLKAIAMTSSFPNSNTAQLDINLSLQKTK